MHYDAFQQPLGVAVDNWQGACPPQKVTQQGRHCRLEPFDRARHGDSLRAALKDERRATPGDAPAAGPHRSDLTAIMVASGQASHGQAAALCSTGEQKALLISILLAAARLQQAKRGHAPLLLLDEIAAHLDPDRRAALFAEILMLGAQAWMTGTDAALFAPFGADAQFLTVDHGRLTPASAS